MNSEFVPGGRKAQGTENVENIEVLTETAENTPFYA